MSLTGPNAAGVQQTSLPNYRLWVQEVNGSGGLYLAALGRRLPLQVIEYDDRSNLQEAVRLTERLIREDKVDLILPPWGTRLNIATAPLLNAAGYPHLTAVAVPPLSALGMTHVDELAKRWPNSFWMLGTGLDNAEALARLLADLRSAGRIGNRVAMIAVADLFGIDAAVAARDALDKHKFDLVYDRAYPLAATDLGSVMADLKQTAPDALIAFSYPEDSDAIVRAARLQAFNPKVFFAAIGTAYTTFRQRFGADADNIMGLGGANATSPTLRAYFARHRDVLGVDADRWASPLVYASLQALGAAVERAGGIDRPAILRELRTGSFETVVGRVSFEQNVYRGSALIGQWQDGEFYGIAPQHLKGVRAPVVPKPDWRPSSARP